MVRHVLYIWSSVALSGGNTLVTPRIFVACSIMQCMFPGGRGLSIIHQPCVIALSGPGGFPQMLSSGRVRLKRLDVTLCASSLIK